MTLQIKILHLAFIIKTFMLRQTLGLSIGYNLIAIEFCYVDRKVSCDSNYLNVCSIFNTMLRHSEIIVVTQFL